MRHWHSLGMLYPFTVPPICKSPRHPSTTGRTCARPAVLRCWTVPWEPKGAESSVVASHFSLAPNGGLHRALLANHRVGIDAKNRYEASAWAVLGRCLPIELTLGKALMGESLLPLRPVDMPREAAADLGPAMTIIAEEAKAEGELLHHPPRPTPRLGSSRNRHMTSSGPC